VIRPPGLPAAGGRPRGNRLGACLALALASGTLACGAAGGVGTVRPGTSGAGGPDAGIELIRVEGGCFEMGADGDDCDATPEERPAHEVCVSAFYIGKFEVTQGQWKSVMGTNTAAASTCSRDDCPVDGVSWSDVQGFLAALNGRGGRRYRLPTEAEWEYAARSGGKAERYSGGKSIDRLAWYALNSGLTNHPVGTKAPNGLGLHDMSGNVWEWTNDWYGDDYYATSPRQDPPGPAGPTAPDVDRVVRGGCKTGEASNERTTRRSFGFQRASGDRSDKIGFRLAKTP